MNPIEKAVLAAVSGITPQPFIIGSPPASRARREWEMREAERIAMKGIKRARRRAAKARRRNGPLSHHELVARCRVLPHESASEALTRSVTESGKTQKEWYWEIYLCSAHWDDLRDKATRAAGGICHDCHVAFSGLDVHHLTYRNIFDVERADLIAVCRGCHEERHGKPRS
jgi:hypothetical protein